MLGLSELRSEEWTEAVLSESESEEDEELESFEDLYSLRVGMSKAEDDDTVDVVVVSGDEDAIDDRAVGVEASRGSSRAKVLR